MRGKDGRFSRRYLKLGITPAYAGKSSFEDIHFIFSRDHPRLCGEKNAEGYGKRSGVGSPPPMRGKVPVNTPLMFSQRITPAYAGKSGGEKECQLCMRDHPRLCGEKVNVQKFDSLVPGSPPPMRGKATYLSHQGRPARITPAYAGKSTHMRNFFIKT